MAVVSGKAYWASVTSPNTTFEPVYTVDLVVDDKTADDFQARGYKVKELSINEEPVGRAITIKRKVNGADGRTRQAPKLFDKDKVPMDEVVGNGSEVKVQYAEWETTNKYGDFKGLDLQAMQVLDLVSYRSGDGDELGSVEGGEEF
tara:strand:+ start:2599 stop:3036 length:438 start_codon:yes stop_codon:yes gene_type:complete